MDTHETSFDTDAPDTLLLGIIETVADMTGQQQESMEPLHSRIDADALARLLTEPYDTRVQLEFSYEDCIVTVSNEGIIRVTHEG